MMMEHNSDLVGFFFLTFFLSFYDSIAIKQSMLRVLFDTFSATPLELKGLELEPSFDSFWTICLRYVYIKIKDLCVL